MSGAETSDVVLRHPPIEALLAVARMMPTDRWRACPVCGKPCPFVFVDADGGQCCAVCRIERDHPETAR